MHELSAGLGIDQLELPGDLADVLPPLNQPAAHSAVPVQRHSVSDSTAAALVPWAKQLEVPGLQG